MSGRSKEEQVCCACLDVRYLPEETNDGYMKERWLCLTCGAEFVRKPKDQFTSIDNGDKK
jgi:hypothetical protein